MKVSKSEFHVWKNPQLNLLFEHLGQWLRKGLSLCFPIFFFFFSWKPPYYKKAAPLTHANLSFDALVQGWDVRWDVCKRPLLAFVFIVTNGSEGFLLQEHYAEWENILKLAYVASLRATVCSLTSSNLLISVLTEHFSVSESAWMWAKSSVRDSFDTSTSGKPHFDHFLTKHVYMLSKSVLTPCLTFFLLCTYVCARRASLFCMMCD